MLATVKVPADLSSSLVDGEMVISLVRDEDGVVAKSERRDEDILNVGLEPSVVARAVDLHCPELDVRHVIVCHQAAAVLPARVAEVWCFVPDALEDEWRHICRHGTLGRRRPRIQ